MSFKSVRIKCAAVRKEGGLRFLIILFIICVAGICFLTVTGFMVCGCAKRAPEPVLELYEESRQGQETSEDGKTPEKEGSPEKVGTLKDEGNPVDEKTAAGEGGMPAASQDSAAGEGGMPAASQDSAAGENGGLSASLEQEKTVTVHVCGAVKKEGVYTLPAGSRIGDAVEAAGGFSREADTTLLNLAAVLQDAWQIRVPTREEAEELRRSGSAALGYGVSGNAAPGNAVFGNAASGKSVSDSGASGGEEPWGGSESGGASGETASEEAADSSGKININTAGKDGLMKIPGIGESKALKIIAYREENGRFESPEDLMKVPGIKKASFEKMKDYIRVE